MRSLCCVLVLGSTSEGIGSVVVPWTSPTVILVEAKNACRFVSSSLLTTSLQPSWLCGLLRSGMYTRARVVHRCSSESFISEITTCLGSSSGVTCPPISFTKQSDRGLTPEGGSVVTVRLEPDTNAIRNRRSGSFRKLDTDVMYASDVVTLMKRSRFIPRKWLPMCADTHRTHGSTCSSYAPTAAGSPPR